MWRNLAFSQVCGAFSGERGAKSAAGGACTEKSGTCDCDGRTGLWRCTSGGKGSCLAGNDGAALYQAGGWGKRSTPGSMRNWDGDKRCLKF